MRIKFTIAAIMLFAFVSSAFAAKPAPPPHIPNSVCIDPGHGGSDAGTSNQGLTEKDVNLQVANILRGKLETAGHIVFMTRETDIALSNSDRYNFCNSEKAAVLISIHHNGSSSSATDYSQALYMKKSDVLLAQKVVNSVSSTLGIQNGGNSRFASGVLLKANMPAAISEGFFLTNTDEYNYLTTGSDRLNQEAQAIFNAINSYFGN